MDDADMSDGRIQSAVDAGIARAKYAVDNPRLRPIILEMDGKRFGVCHHCESTIQPGHLFCPAEPEYSCAAGWEHERRRMDALGR